MKKMFLTMALALTTIFASAQFMVVADLDVEDLRRIERIVERAKFTMVMEHSLSFFFKTIGAGVSGLAAAAIGAAKNVSPNNKIKKSEKDNDTDNCSGK